MDVTSTSRYKADAAMLRGLIGSIFLHGHTLVGLVSVSTISERYFVQPITECLSALEDS